MREKGNKINDLIGYNIILLLIGGIALRGMEVYIYAAIIVLLNLIVLMIKSIYRDLKNKKIKESI